MRQDFIDASMSPEEKVNKLLKMVERLSRRSVKHSVAVIPPIPISCCVSGDIDGTIFRYMFSCIGTINKLGVVLDRKPDSTISIILNLDGEDGSSSKSYYIDKKSRIIDLDISVKSLDRLSIDVNSDRNDINEVWIALLWTPSIKSSTIQQHLIDKLDEVSNGLHKEGD